MDYFKKGQELTPRATWASKTPSRLEF
jgi:ankyrin repeat protein